MRARELPLLCLALTTWTGCTSDPALESGGLDLLLFFALLGLFGLLFVGFQIALLRLHDTRHLLLTLLGTYLVSAAVGSALGWWLLAAHFSSFATFVVADAGAVVAGFFAAGLYAFLGPATADRSLTAHFMVYLLAQPGGVARQAEIGERFSAENFLAKRFEECTTARLLVIRDGVVHLTPKGRFMARLYAVQLKLLGLERRSRYLPSFPPEP